MSTTAPVEVVRTEAVATVRLNRPDAMNSLDGPTKDALLAALRDVAGDDDVRCVVLTGSGRAFCVGQDLKEHVGKLRGGGPGGLAQTVLEHYNPIAELLATMDKPVLAAINGAAAGAGASFAMACDARVMAESGGMNLAFAGIALSCDSGTSYWLPRLVGPAKAKELLFFPRTIKAAECLELGLVNQVVPDAELESTVGEMAAKLAAGPTKAYGAMRQSVTYASGRSLVDALAFEAEQMQRTGDCADHLAAVEAFLAKEKPTFTGR